VLLALTFPLWLPVLAVLAAFARQPHPVDPRQPKGGDRDSVNYDLGYYSGLARDQAGTGGGGSRSGCAVFLLALPAGVAAVAWSADTLVGVL
jgi:hypothetical protein